MVTLHLIMMTSVFVVQDVTAQQGKKEIAASAGGARTKAFHFPWLATIHKITPAGNEFFGSGSIISQRWVIGSLDSFIRRSKQSNKPYYQEIANLFIYSGSIWGEPYKSEGAAFLEKRKVGEVYFLTYPDIDAAALIKFGIGREPQGLKDLKRSPFGLSMNIAAIAVDTGFQWKRTTLPLPLYSGDAKTIEKRVAGIIRELEMFPPKFTCYVGGWRIGYQRMIQYQVVYVPIKQCKTMYCSYDLRACASWPVEGVHGCFKSLEFTDLCWRDQGSALYCEAFDNSILAVLTTAPTCGYRGLPGVYTWISAVLNLYNRVSESKYQPMQDLSKFLPPPKDKLLPADN